MHEFEIKVSRSDFRADFKKSLSEYQSARIRRPEGNSPFRNPDGTKVTAEEAKALMVPYTKHELLAEGYEKGPAYFWFCTPEGLLKPEDIPAYAGHIEVIDTNPDEDDVYPPPYRPSCMKVVKQAPKLHKQKFPDKYLKAIMKQIAYRYQDMYFTTRPQMIARHRRELCASRNL